MFETDLLKSSTTTRFAFGPDEEDITIHYTSRRFEVRGKDIAGPIIYAFDDKLAPDIPKGAKLLVNSNAKTVDKDGVYVFRKAGTDCFDIALVERLEDGTYRYVSDKENPETVTDISKLDLVGRVWEAQVIVEIADGGVAGDEHTPSRKGDPNKKYKVWFPLWTDVSPKNQRC